MYKICSFIIDIFIETNCMKRVLLMIVTLTLSLALCCQVHIYHSEAQSHKGDTVRLIGSVTDIKQVTKKKDSSTIMYFETSDSRRPIILVVPNNKGEKSKKVPAITYLNQCVQVTGVIKSCKGKSA